MDEKNEFSERELVPSVSKRSSVAVAIIAVILSGVVFGSIGYWYGTTIQKNNSQQSELTQVDLPIVSSATATAKPKASSTTTVSKTPTATSTASVTSTATTVY